MVWFGHFRRAPFHFYFWITFKTCSSFESLKMQLRAFHGAGSMQTLGNPRNWFRCVDSATADTAASTDIVDAWLLLLQIASEFSPFGRIWWGCFIGSTNYFICFCKRKNSELSVDNKQGNFVSFFISLLTCSHIRTKWKNCKQVLRCLFLLVLNWS